MLVWSDQENQTFVAYNAPQYLNQRHQLEACSDQLAKMAGALDKFAKAATQKPESKD
jgi:hypothetical protein